MTRIAIALLAFASVAKAGIIYDATADFSTAANPNGVWSYRFSDDTIRDGDYALLGHVAGLAPGPGQGSDVWHADAGEPTAQRPFAGINTTGVAGGGTWLQGELALHPGRSNNQSGDGLAALVWDSPNAGTADVSFELAMGLGGNVAWYFERNDGSDTLASGTLNGLSDTASISLSDVAINFGDTLNLVLDNNEETGSDLVRITTGTINFSAVPEPSAFGLLTTLMIGLGLRRNRRVMA